MLHCVATPIATLSGPTRGPLVPWQPSCRGPALELVELQRSDRRERRFMQQRTAEALPDIFVRGAINRFSSPACASVYECYRCGLGLGLTVAVASTAHDLIKLGYRAEAQSVRKA
jgi:hypothetical protein